MDVLCWSAILLVVICFSIFFVDSKAKSWAAIPRKMETRVGICLFEI